ncbi:FCD domain-containing protein, partial [Rhizobium ruizarguesonis]
RNEKGVLSVRVISLKDYLDSLTIRMLLEPEAAVLSINAIPRRLLMSVRQEIHDLLGATAYHKDAHWFSDDNLNNMIIDHCGNAVMAKVLRELRATTRLFEIDRLKDRLKPDSTEHLVIIEAIDRGDVEETRR